MSNDACFHCALPVERADEFQVEIEGELRPVCCPGCKAVAELIRDTGMSSYYAMREPPQPGAGKPADDAAEWQIYDRDDMLGAFAELADDQATATIYVGKMYCAACSWLIETALTRLPGIASAEVSPVTHRLRVSWYKQQQGLGRILATLASLGYDPQPLSPETTARPEIAEQRAALKRLLVASLGMMQVMMFAVGLYAGDFQGMEASMQYFLRLVSFVVTTPVVFYSARPFFAGAWRGIVSRMPGMDLPVSIAIAAAYTGSVYAMLTSGPAVWFDSVVMFVFFLTLGRFLEMRARHRSIDRSTALSTLLPNTVNKVDADGETTIPSSQLVSGDVLLVRPGESIAADGILIEGTTTLDEALLTGESEPLAKSAGDALIAGSINLDGLIRMRVEKTGSDTTLGAISRLSERARYARPAFVQTADRVASYIVIAILLIAVLVATSWYFIAPDRAFVITLSVLVVTCPCALALATPAAFATAGTRLSELHLLITNGNAIEAMSRARRILFDKTGTLTRGAPEITAIQVFDKARTEQQCLQIAAAIETVSTHPIAIAFSIAANEVVATDQRVAIGNGVAGTIDGQRWRLGRHAFATGDERDGDTLTTVYLATNNKLVARFDLNDEIRPGAMATLAELRSLGLRPALVSGDNAAAVQRVAGILDIDDYHSGCSPGDKLEIIRAAQNAGDTVIMVGDGINDAPVLAGADASVAPVHGALLAQTSADVILLGESLAPLVLGIRLARKTMRIVRQNLAWAVVYNAVALPLAAGGLVPPWAAAIGMSASSLIVVLNALRLSRFGAT
ncbi:MAG: heavy metal translocating P-type ATPase [Gammaproteobacteria bacterium]|nr:heavy metal translocating P-type ATPase [Gammaproteobacteria bacterium]